MSKDITSEIKKKTVIISESEYKKLKNDSEFLEVLQRAGVDNWDGYDHAVNMYENGE